MVTHYPGRVGSTEAAAATEATPQVHAGTRALEWMRQANRTGEPAHARYVVFADRPRLLNSVEEIESVAVRASRRSRSGWSFASRSTATSGGVTSSPPDVCRKSNATVARTTCPGSTWSRATSSTP